MPHPQSSSGIWVAYAGARWYNSGAAVQDEPDKFSAVGEYRGFPVYRAKNGWAEDIYLATAGC